MDDEQRKKRLRHWKTDVNAIRRILRAEWNPIGCGVPDDEYDSYIPGIYGLMQSGADAAELSRHLQRLETVNMGVTGNDGTNDQVACSLLALWASIRDEIEGPSAP